MFIKRYGPKKFETFLGLADGVLYVFYRKTGSEVFNNSKCGKFIFLIGQ